MAKFPSRIHALLARDAQVGVIIRRGPSKQVCTVLWDRGRDEFQLGQWLKGRIYERRCDLSADGKYLIYFAMSGKWNSEVKGSWTAISRAPYLKGIAVFPKGDCWNGGGLFTTKKSYWLNDGCGHSVLRNTNELRRDAKFRPTQNFGGECLSVYYPRLLRDGWTLVQRVNPAKGNNVDVFEKPLGAGWVLRKIAHAEIGAPMGKGCYWDEHELLHPQSEVRIPCPHWEWAELERDRLVWAEGGKLFQGGLDKVGLAYSSELFDFNEMAFSPIEAPY
jgi:hypothetical protein